MATSWIIGYDVADPRRLGRLYREMCRHAMPLEYSVFLLVGTETAKNACLAAAVGIINGKADDVRCYPLPVRGFQGGLGRASLPSGITWTGLPVCLT